MNIGYVLAVGCAIAWSAGIILFKNSAGSIHPGLLNLTKNIIGFLCMIPTVLLIEGTLAHHFTSEEWIILFGSGCLGIGFADALVLKSLQVLGPSRLAVLECLYSPFVIVMSLLFLGEKLNLRQSLGIVMVLGALLLVLVQKSQDRLESSRMLRGVALGAFGLFLMAIGIVWAKPLLEVSPLFSVITIRLFAGVLGSIASFMVLGTMGGRLRDLWEAPKKGQIFLASFLSTYISMMMWVGGFKYVEASIASVLNQTTTIFTVLFAVIFLKEKLTFRKMAGAILAFCGVGLITLGGN